MNRAKQFTTVPPQAGWNLTLDPRSFVPYYEQIAQQVREIVASGTLKPGATFASEGELARRLGISKMPVRQAFRSLASQGLLVISKGKRPRIAEGRVPWDFHELRSFSEEMRRRGLKPSSKVLSVELARPGAEISSTLKIGLQEPVYKVARLRYVNSELVGFETSYLPARIFPQLDKQDLQSLYSVIEKVYRHKIESAEEEISAVPAGPEEAKILQVKVGSTILMIREVTYDTLHSPLVCSNSLFLGNRYITMTFSRRRR
jgi:GntR family transcriptional regulator